MSRMSMAPAARNLTLTEELEKLEQSITLTLQEIDHNFSRAHRIVTQSILPVVEQYGKHSEAVWEGSKFWKQFFEASANVSLSGYQEPNPDESTVHDETGDSHTYTEDPTEQQDEDTVTGTITPTKAESSNGDDDRLEDSILSSPSLAHAHSTPRMPNQPAPPTASFAEFSSPYESLRREIHGPDEEGEDGTHHQLEPTTPGRGHTLPDMSMTPLSSPFGLATTSQHPVNNDPILHRVLDKTYRIAATPHTVRKQREAAAAATAAAAGSTRFAATPATATRTARTRYTIAPDLDSSPVSSPEIAAPQLRADIFSSPMKTPRTPGVSVMRTPGRKGGAGADASARAFGKSPAGFADIHATSTTAGGTTTAAGTSAWDSDDDIDIDGIDISPPKTMQFHVPQTRLLQTPAREASKRIVEDLLMTAGGDITDSLDEDSPSVVRRNQELDDSF